MHIGDDTLIATNCYIIDCDHGIHANELIRTQHNTVEPIFIENDCWIATDVSILKGKYNSEWCNYWSKVFS